jgi:hypothetical protein
VHTEFWWGSLSEGDHLEDQGVDEKIVLNGYLRSGMGGGHGRDQSGSGQGQVTGSCKCGDEPSGSIKSGEFLE